MRLRLSIWRWSIIGYARYAPLLLPIVISAAVISAQALAFSPAGETAPAQAPTTRCRLNVWGVLLRGGLAYASKSTVPLKLICPCPDSAPTAPPVPEQEGKPTAPANRLTELSATEVMRQARLLFVRRRSAWFDPEKLERELLKRKEFGELGLEITRNFNNTELILEITRKRFTTRFTCNIIEPTTQRIVAGTTVSSLGGELEPDLAGAIIKQFKAARSKPAVTEKLE